MRGHCQEVLLACSSFGVHAVHAALSWLVLAVSTCCRSRELSAQQLRDAKTE